MNDRISASPMAARRDSETEQQIKFIEYDLENGMHVILAESHAVALVSVNLWYHVGSKDEDPTRTGFAHLFEHLMFQGSKNVKKIEHFKYVQEAGGTLNATTSQDRTNYFETVPSSHLPLALWLESDRMMSLDLTTENFENQRAVVKEERRQRYDNRPYGLVYENLLKHVFPALGPEGQPLTGYNWATIGSMAHLDETNIAEVRAFHDRFYVPNNASLVIAGDFKEDEARSQVERFFGSIPRGKAIVRRSQIVAPLLRQTRVILNDSVALPRVSLAFQGAEAFSKGEYVLDVMSDILGSGRSSRLYNSLVYKDCIAKDVSVMNIVSEKGGMFVVSATAQQGINPERVEAALWHELERMKNEHVLENELAKAKNSHTAETAHSLVQLAQRADRLQRAYAYTGNTLRYLDDTSVIQSVTASDVKEYAGKLFNRDASVVLSVMPKTRV